ncbi:MAG: hypothetical protein ABIC40_01145 [bacterium]
MNPYKLFADTLGPTDPIENIFIPVYDENGSRAVFSAGIINTRRYRIKFEKNPDLIVKFGYAVDASWAPPTVKPPDDIPADFPPEANQPEAIYIKTSEIVNSLWYDEDTGNSGGVLRLDAWVTDWQGYPKGDSHIETDSVLLTSSDLNLATTLMMSELADMVHARYAEDLWTLTDPTASGEAVILLEAVSKNGPAWDQGPNIAPPGDIRAYQVMTVNVVDPECETDENNDFSESESFVIGDRIVGTMCLGTDNVDYYDVNVPFGFSLSGQILFIHDNGIHKIYLYDGNQKLVMGGPSYTDYSVLNFDNTSLEPGLYYIKLETQSGTGPFQYLLDTGLVFNEIIPDNPVEVTPIRMDLAANWVGSAPDYCYFTGQAGTWGVHTNEDADPTVLGRTYDRIETRPAFYPPYIYYVEKSTDAPAVLEMVDYSITGNPVHHDQITSFANPIEYMTMNSENLYICIDILANPSILVFDWASDPVNPQLIGLSTA